MKHDTKAFKELLKQAILYLSETNKSGLFEYLEPYTSFEQLSVVSLALCRLFCLGVTVGVLQIQHPFRTKCSAPDFM